MLSTGQGADEAQAGSSLDRLAAEPGTVATLSREAAITLLIQCVALQSAIVSAMTGSEVRRLRKRLGLTQVQLAERLGVTASSVARWEQGVLGIRESAARLLRLVAQTESTAKRKRGRR